MSDEPEIPEQEIEVEIPTNMAGLAELRASLDEYFHQAELEAAAENMCPEGTPKLDQNYAGYMELEGAVKDGRCKVVSDEISKEKGCCNLFHPKPSADKFSCGTCKYVGE